VPSTVSSRSTPFSSRSSKPSSPSSKSSPESLAISTLSRSLSQPASSARSSELVVGDDVPHGCIPVPADDQLVEERAGHTADLVRPVGLGPVGAPIHREGGVAGARAVKTGRPLRSCCCSGTQHHARSLPRRKAHA